MNRARTLGILLVAAGSLRGSPARAQLSASANAALFSAYVWRGVTYTNRFVIQPDASVTVPVRMPFGRTSLTAGVWANIEPARYNGFGDISEGGGTKDFDVTEFDWTGELAIPVTEGATLTLGATGYRFPNSDGLTRTSNSVELYGRTELGGVLNPMAALYYDVGSVDGAYFESGISHSFALGASASLTLGALAGVSSGQDADYDAEDEPRATSYNFDRNGFTHADLWTSADFTAGALSITPTAHVIVTGDGATKVSRIERDPDTGEDMPNETGTKLWLGVTIGWAR